VSFKPGTDTDVQKAAREMAKRVAAEDERLRAEFIEAITETFGRPVTGAESILIASLASAHVRAARLRKRGRNDLEELRVIASLTEALAKTRDVATA